MKVLFILHLPPPTHGASMVGQFIFQSEAVKSAFQPRFINLGTSRTIDEIGKNPIQKVIRYVGLLLNVLWQLIVFRPQMVYMTLSSGGTGFYKDFPIAIISKIFGVQIVYHFHNKGIVKYQDRWVDDKLYRMAFKNAKVILLSEYLYSDIQKYVNKSDVFYCPNGIPESQIAHDHSWQIDKMSRASGNFNKDTSLQVEILFLSNLIESKGVFILLEACNHLMKKQINFQCTLVGGEGDITTIQLQQQINELGIGKAVRYVGKLYGEEKERIFQNSQIFVLPTYYHNECMPLVLIEAMQHALPIVSTYEGAIPGMVNDGENGFLVPQRDAHALAAKLEDLIMNPDLRSKMGKAGRERYLWEFTLEAFENRFVNILKDISLINPI